MRGSRTAAKKEELIFAEWSQSLSYAATARAMKVPVQTVQNVVHRLSGDDLEGLRRKFRERLATEAWDRVGDLIRLVTPENLGSEHSSQGSEASRAAHDLARVAHLLDRRDSPGDQLPPSPVVQVFTGCAPPPEIQAEEEQSPASVAGTDAGT